MSIGLSILMVLIASSFMNVAVVLFKKTITGLAPADHRLRRIAGAIFGSQTGVAGLSLLLLGYAGFAVAASVPEAPISVLQPLGAFGTVVLAVLSVVILRERFDAMEWLGVASLVLGVVLLGASVTVAPGTPSSLELPRFLLLITVIAIGSAILLSILLARAGLPLVELLFGIQAGVIMGVGYLCMKGFFLAWHDHSPFAPLFGLGIVLGSGGGFCVLLIGMTRGRALIAKTTSFVVNQTTVVFGSWWCLGERLPSEPLPRWERVVGLGVIVIGIVLLARFQESHREKLVEPT